MQYALYQRLSFGLKAIISSSGAHLVVTVATHYSQVAPRGQVLDTALLFPFERLT